MQRQILLKHQYDIAIMLGGTNDLGSLEASEIAENLWSICSAFRTCESKKNTLVIIMTMPSSKAQVLFPRYADRCRAVNAILAERVSKESSNNVRLMDLYSLVPYPQNFNDKEASEQLRLWDMDGLHFSAAGYTRIGELLFERVLHQPNNAEDGSKSK
jgi:lysophospholipase L1-like esterase